MAKTNGAKRNPDGTFAPGHAGGPGRPKRTTETGYLLALADVVSLDDWREIAEKARDDAKAGDDKARAWLSKHLLGDTLLSTALALELVSSDAIHHLLFSMTAQLVRNEVADLATIQDLAAVMKERKLGRKPTDIDRLLDNIEIGNQQLLDQMLDDLDT